MGSQKYGSWHQRSAANSERIIVTIITTGLFVIVGELDTVASVMRGLLCRLPRRRQPHQLRVDNVSVMC
jgi:hypothetical protein